MAVREVKGVILQDTRRFFAFYTHRGRIVETKALTRKEAKGHIERCLSEKIRRAA